MGIRFACHVCGKQLNIKRDLAGKRGVCPKCQSRFRIPLENTVQSTPVEAAQVVQQPVQQPVQQLDATVPAPDGGGTAVMVETQVGHAADMHTQAGSQTDSVGQPVETPDMAHLATGSILDDEPESTWYVRPPSGGQYGPASSEDLRDWIKQGRVAATALLWRDGWPQWRDAGEALPELSARLPGAVAAGNNLSTNIAPSGVGTLANLDSDRQKAKVSGSGSTVSFSGDNGIGAERRSRTMRRFSMILILIVIAVTLILVLGYVINS